MTNKLNIINNSSILFSHSRYNRRRDGTKSCSLLTSINKSPSILDTQDKAP